MRHTLIRHNSATWRACKLDGCKYGGFGGTEDEWMQIEVLERLQRKIYTLIRHILQHEGFLKTIIIHHHHQVLDSRLIEKKMHQICYVALLFLPLPWFCLPRGLYLYIFFGIQVLLMLFRCFFHGILYSTILTLTLYKHNSCISVSLFLSNNL